MSDTLTEQSSPSTLVIGSATAGDTRIGWDPKIPAEVANAKRHFDDMKAKKYLAYKVDKDSGEATSEIIREFDPTAGEIVMMPQIVGG